ncbi:MAG TPA: DUF6098 family protein, partial [Acidimicrobiales bacterium]|nr:DUF6098 family protein [Acidimicrobiales bacterium]
MSGPELTRMGELEELVAAAPGLFLRWSRGPEADEDSLSRDHESGLVLPGLSVNPLTPEPWWTRPLGDWLARQLCQYGHLLEEADDERVAWLLTGE